MNYVKSYLSSLIRQQGIGDPSLLINLKNKKEIQITNATWKQWIQIGWTVSSHDVIDMLLRDFIKNSIPISMDSLLHT